VERITKMKKINVEELRELFIEIKYGNNIAFEKLYKEGKVRNFGVSNHNSMQIELLNKYLTNNIIREVNYEKN